MAKKKLSAALAAGGGVGQYIPKDDEEFLRSEDLLEKALEARNEEGNDAANIMYRNNRRNTLLAKAGYDFLHIDEISPNEYNSYTVDEASVEALAELILSTGIVDPIWVRTTQNGFEIIDGERRYRACKYLAETVDEKYGMIPAKVFPLNDISDEDAEFLMHAGNIGQRAMTASERAKGIAAVADRVVSQRNSNPAFKGRKTAEILAEQFGISERAAYVEVSIGNATEEVQTLLDEKVITKAEAYQMSQLSSEEQKVAAERLSAGNAAGEDAVEEKHGGGRPKKTAPKTCEAYLKTARNALKAAMSAEGYPDEEIIGQIKKLLRELETESE